VAATHGPRVLIEALAAYHDRALFSCGIEALDGYLRRQAGQDARRHGRHVAATFVLLETGIPTVL